MTSLLLSTRTCHHYGLKSFQTSPEVALWHWHAHVFDLDGKQHLIVVEERSIYAVVVFAINQNVEDCVDAFVRKLERQIAAMDPQKEAVLLSSFLSQINVYPTPFKGKPMTMITHLIGKLKDVFEQTGNPTVVKSFAETDLNEIPWKVNDYKSPTEVLKSMLRN